MTKIVRARSRITLPNKAKSRLKNRKRIFAHSHHSSSPTHSVTSVQNKQSKIPSTVKKLLSRYLHHWPGLLLSIGLGEGMWIFLNQIHPSQVQHAFLANSYLPLILLFFCFCLFSASFILLNSHFGLIISLWLTSWLFLRLHQVENEFTLLIILAVAFGFSELVSLIVKHYTKKRRQTRHSNSPAHIT